MGFWTGMREAQLDRMKNRAVAEQTEIEEKRCNTSLYIREL